MIKEKINILKKLIEENNIEDENLNIILHNAIVIFENNDLNSFDKDLIEEIKNNWNQILDEQIKLINDRKKVL